jgi:hypothetical protein
LILSAQISFVPVGGAKIKIDMSGDWQAKTFSMARVARATEFFNDSKMKFTSQ